VFYSPKFVFIKTEDAFMTGASCELITRSYTQHH